MGTLTGVSTVQGSVLLLGEGLFEKVLQGKIFSVRMGQGRLEGREDSRRVS